MSKSGMVQYALAYERRFHAIVPVGAWTYTDSTGAEHDLWKAPLIKRWTAEPIHTDEGIIFHWNKYARHGKTPNIGLVTGQICGGYIVIDLDNKPDRGINGYDELLHWEKNTGRKIPQNTWTVITGSRGYHLYFHTDRALRGYQNPAAGIDLRADGGQVVLPPSTHRNGNRYEWECGLSPWDIPCADATEDVYALIDQYRPSGSEYAHSTYRGEGGTRKMILPPEILEGGRHDPLISLIGTLNRLGVSDATIKQTVRAENLEKCKPPFTEEELEREIFPAIFRWEKGVSEEEWFDRKAYKARDRHE